MLCADWARARYNAYMRGPRAGADASLRPRDDDEATVQGHLEEQSGQPIDDPVLFEALEPLFAKYNRPSTAQRAYFNKLVADFKAHPERLNEATSILFHPDDPTLVPLHSAQGEFEANNWGASPVLFFSPSEMTAWAKLGVTVPCPHCGFTRATQLHARCAARLVKAISRDYVLAGREVVCPFCRARRTEVKKLIEDEMKRVERDEELLYDLREELKSLSPTFMTFDRRVLAHYRADPELRFVAERVPIYLTHKAAIDLEVLDLLLHASGRTALGHASVEELLRAFRSIQATRLETACFSAQRRAHALDGGCAKFTDVRFGISSVSDSYLSAVLELWFDEYKDYLLRFFEQMVPMDSAAADHHCKFAFRMRCNGDRSCVNVYKVMNSWGGLVISIFTLIIIYIISKFKIFIINVL